MTSARVINGNTYIMGGFLGQKKYFLPLTEILYSGRFADNRGKVILSNRFV